MIPIKDTIQVRRFPLVNTLLILVNILVFLFEVSITHSNQNMLIYGLGIIPSNFRSGNVFQWLTILTSMFLHGSWIHLISNMLALYIFGDNVEDRLGHYRYLTFYFLGGIIAGLSHVIAYPTSTLPTVGASGAIAAVLGAYLVLYPHAKVVTILPIFFFIQVVRIPAVIYLGFWFLSQLLNGSLAVVSGTFQGGGVAWWAHIGGFIFGMLMIWAFVPRRRGRQQVYTR